MLTSESEHLVRLVVETADPATDILVIDGALNVKARGQGRLEAELPPGIYKIRLRAGEVIHDLFQVLEGPPVTLRVGADILRLPSAAPLATAANTTARHMEAAHRASREVHVRLGQGSQLFFFCRDAGQPGKATARQHPATDLSLHDLSGRTLVEIERAGRSEHAAEKGEGGHPGDGPWAACNVSVDPGT